MFGFRTPVKTTESGDKGLDSKSATERAGPSHTDNVSASNVRRSIGEWEAGKTEPKTKTALPTTTSLGKTKSPHLSPQPLKSPSVVPLRTKPKTAFSASQGSATFLVALPEQPETYTDRSSEAKACLSKAKLYLSSSRNLKLDIRTGVTAAIERLYQLVKEAEADRKGKDGLIVKETPEKVLVEELKEVAIDDLSRKLLDKIEEHASQLKEHGKKMEGLKISLEEQKASP